MKSTSGILLNPSGKVVRILELTFLADSGIRALALVAAYVSATIRYQANFVQGYSERTMLNALFWIRFIGRARESIRYYVLGGWVGSSWPWWPFWRSS